MLADPLFIDPYAAVLLSHDVAHHHMDYLVSHAVVCYDHYRLTTRYIDDKLQNLVSNSEDIRQVNLTKCYAKPFASNRWRICCSSLIDCSVDRWNGHSSI
jgi:hypothetical protein